MEIGMSYWFGFPSFPEERATLIKQAGFTNVALHWTNEYESITGDRYTIPRILEKKDIKISSLHLSYERSHFLWNPGQEGINYRQDIHQAIDDASSLGIRVVVMHSDGVISDEFEIMKTLQELFEYASKKNVFLCVENLQHEDNLKRIFEKEFFRNIPVCYDLGHANIRNSQIECNGNKNIRYFHIHDNDGIHDIHGLPFSGTIDWEDKVAMLANYREIPKILEVHGNINNHKCAEEYLFMAKRVALAFQ